MERLSVPLLVWDPALELGFGDIDIQHRRLVELIGELDDVHRAGVDPEVVDAVLDDVIHFTVHHFSFEEGLMDEYKIRGSERHKEEHKRLLVQVYSFRTKLRTGEVALADLLTLLRTWLTEHIVTADRDLVRELKAKGARSTH